MLAIKKESVNALLACVIKRPAPATTQINPNISHTYKLSFIGFSLSFQNTKDGKLINTRDF